MPISEKGLRNKAKKHEHQALQKNKINSELIPTFVEILRDVYATSQPKQSDYFNRHDLVRVFNEIAKEIFGNCDDCPIVEGFGSFSMDLFSDKSDLDLSVNFGDNVVDFPREKKIQALRKLAKKFYALQGRGHVSAVQPIFAAKVPILKVIDSGTGIECDISIENRDGVVKSKIVHLICSIDERFQMLSFLTKAWAKAQGINSSKDRTLNSLSIISLVAFHLQTRHPPILPPFFALLKDGPDPSRVQKLVTKFPSYGKKNQESVAELFVTLLIKLASVETLWPKGLCASLLEGAWVLKTWKSRYGVMSVEDFTDRSENVARAVGKGEVKRIYKCIDFSLHHIRSFMDGKIQATKLRNILFGREGADKQAPSLGKRTLQPCSNFEPILKKMRSDGSWEGTNMQPIPFTAVLKQISAVNTTTPEITWGGGPTRCWSQSNPPANGKKVVWKGTKGWPQRSPPATEEKAVWRGTKGWPQRSYPATGEEANYWLQRSPPATGKKVVWRGTQGWPQRSHPPATGKEAVWNGTQGSPQRNPRATGGGVVWRGTGDWTSGNSYVTGAKEQKSQVVWGEKQDSETSRWGGASIKGWQNSHCSKKTTV